MLWPKWLFDPGQQIFDPNDFFLTRVKSIFSSHSGWPKWLENFFLTRVNNKKSFGSKMIIDPNDFFVFQVFYILWEFYYEWSVHLKKMYHFAGIAFKNKNKLNKNDELLKDNSIASACVHNKICCKET